MACCILAAFLLGQCVLVWRWLVNQFGGTSKPPAALWSPSQPRDIKRRRQAFAWIAGIGIAAGGIGAWSMVIVVRHAAPSISAWCYGEIHER